MTRLQFFFRLHLKLSLDTGISAALLLCFFLSAAFAKQYADVIFLIDNTENMKTSTSERVKHFISQVIRQLDIGLNKYRIGLAQFSGIGKVEFLLNTYENKEEVLGHIQRSIAFTGGSLQNESAMEFLKKTFLMNGAGSRLSDGTPQVVVIFTSVSRNSIMDEAWILEEIGVKVTSVDIEYFDKLKATASKAYQIYEVESIDPAQQNIVSDIETSLQTLYDLDSSVPAGMLYQKSKTGRLRSQLTGNPEQCLRCPGGKNRVQMADSFTFTEVFY